MGNTSRQQTGRPPDVDALLVAAGRGDLAAFESLYDQTIQLIYRIVIEKGLRPEETEHLTRAIYLHIWRNAPLYDPRRNSAAASVVATALNHLGSGVMATTAVEAKASGNAQGPHIASR